MGASADPESIAYLRPETAQSIFVQFKNVLTGAEIAELLDAGGAKVLITLAPFYGGVLLFFNLPDELAPQEDQGLVIGFSSAPALWEPEESC